MYGRQCDFLLPAGGYRRLLWVRDFFGEQPLLGLAYGNQSGLREQQSGLGRGHPAVASEPEAGLPVRLQLPVR